MRPNQIPEWLGPIILEYLTYDPETGVIRWKKNKGGRAKAGAIAGCVAANGYLHIRLNNRLLLGHHVAWFLMTGEFPQTLVDHKDQNPENNKWENLRKATGSQNVVNSSSRTKSRTGFRGVRLTPQGKYQVRICYQKKTTYCGVYDKADEAAAVYNRRAQEIHGEFAVLNRFAA